MLRHILGIDRVTHSIKDIQCTEVTLDLIYI